MGEAGDLKIGLASSRIRGRYSTEQYGSEFKPDVTWEFLRGIVEEPEFDEYKHMALFRRQRSAVCPLDRAFNVSYR